MRRRPAWIPFTESQIQQALDLIMANSTAIIIAHRLSTVRSADRIIVLQKGRIIEEGSHQPDDTQRRALRRTLRHVLPPPVAQVQRNRIKLAQRSE
jgi:ABC-type transport system involved in cytochrome bd biosynthesis fused ATPase/permease subunit